MANDESFEDDGAGGSGVQHLDAHGFAALLLIESLIHELIARSALGRQGAVDLVSGAAEVAADLASDAILPPRIAARTRDLLNAIRSTLEIDLPNSATD